MAETAIENYIRAFVHSKTGEDVVLDLKDYIAVRHVSKRGSIALAILWAKILQHQNNFPTSRFSYRRQTNKAAGTDRLSLVIDDVTFSVFMTTGTLRIDGPFVYDWFTKKFKSLLDVYDIGFNEIYKDLAQPKYTAKPMTRIDYDPDTSEYLALMSKRFSPTKSDRLLESKILDHTRDVGKANDVKGLLSDEELNVKLEELRFGGVKSGPDFIYPVWRSLLNRWFSKEGYSVYIVTPSLDCQRLRDIAQLNIAHNLTADLQGFYVRPRCNEKLTLADIKRSTLETFDSKIQLFVEYKVFRKILIPLDVFHCKFIAAVKGDSAEILLTSASFNGHHFDQQNMDTAMFLTITPGQFESSYLAPLANSLVTVP